MIPILVVNILFLKNTFSFIFVLLLVLGLGISITFKEYKLATKNLDQTISAGRLESIIINLEDAVIAYDSNFQILIFNHAAESMFGIKKESVIGQTIGPERASEQGFGLITQTLFPSLAPSVVTRSRANQYPQVVDITFTEPVRNFRVSTDRILDKNNNPMGFVKVIKDRTREVTLIQSKSEFVSVAAHQLRTPLTAINWTFQGLTKNELLTEEDKGLLQNGLQATSNLLKTVEDLLNTAEIEEGRFGYKLAEIDLIQFIDTILSNAQVIAREFGLQIFFDKGNLSEFKITVDQSKLALALSNLIDNSMKYNSQNGSVTVKLRQLTDKPYVQISVKDTGVGIPPGDVDKLFKKFYRASNARKVKADGSGLGLYITKNIINQHGGSIWVESTLGRGTTFHFTLPTDPSLIPNSETPLAI
jgi:two-component system sensor histidine kinase VicK